MNLVSRLRAHAWPLVCAVLLGFFAFTRLYQLDLRPIHHDEGVNGLFMKTLIQDGRWSYDPQNYHGPTLYFFQLIPSWIASFLADGSGRWSLHSISGLNIVSLRAVTGCVGILLLLLILRSWPLLGRWGAVAACLFAGASCDILFFNRYFIHESYVLLFTLGCVTFGYEYRRTRRRLYALLCALSATLLFCTKETSVFHFIVIGLAYWCAQWTHWIAAGRPGPFGWRERLRAPAHLRQELGRYVEVIVIVSTVVWAMFFSSFFTHAAGPIDSIRSYFFWGAEGVESGHVKPFFYYLSTIIVRYEAINLLFAFVGMAAAFLTNDKRGLFLTFWTLGMCGFYSMVPYKTPWLVVNLSLPMALVAGRGIHIVVRTARAHLTRPHATLALTSLAGIGLFLMVAEARQTHDLNFIEYDNDRHPQIYAHTVRDINGLVTKVHAAAVRAGRDMEINVLADIYWPLPLYLVQYPNVRFWGDRLQDVQTMDAPVLIVAPKLQADVDARLKDTYVITNYSLRPGVPLALYINTKVAPGAVTLQTMSLLRSQPTPPKLRPGLRLEVFRGSQFTGKRERVTDGDVGYDFSWRIDAEKKFTPPFSLKWTGYLKVDKAGLYRFVLESDDGSWLTIDGEPVIDNGGDHAVVRLARGVQLSAGFHKIELRYYDVLGEAVLHFKWTPPGGGEAIVPPTVFFQPS